LFLELLSTECPFFSVHQLGADVATLWLRHGCPWSIGCGDPRSQKRDLGHPSRFSDTTHSGGTEARIALYLFGGLRDDRGGGLETYFGMGSVAEWLVDGCAAATERNGGLARKVDLCPVGVNQLDRTFHAKWSVWSHRDCYFTLSHEHPSSEI
jgi:hypothetical protein